MTIEVPSDWDKLTPEQKRERRFDAWLTAEEVQFVSPEAQSGYRARVKRLAAVIRMEKPDRVPITPFLGEFVATYAGYTQQDMVYDVDKAIDAANRCTLELDFDAKTPAARPDGPIWDILNNKQRNWPGRGLPADGSPQFIEGEYMLPDEYESFMLDETEFRWRSYLPRIWGAAEALKNMDLSGNNLSSFGQPEVKSALQRIIQAGEESKRLDNKITRANAALTEFGYPDFRATALGTAPFDYIGDNLRGQRGVALDLYRRPDVLIEAIEVITRKRLNRIRLTANRIGGSPIVGFPLHKGADGFMSDQQFRTFYWPSLRRIVSALIDEGFVPELRTQGSYDSRLEAILDLPKRSVIWHFYQTDLKKAKAAVGNSQCIVGSVPQSLLSVGSTREIELYVRNLIDIGGRDGGFVVTSPGALGKDAKPDNVRALVKAVKAFGMY